MDPRERWQALQAQLTTARRRLEEGDRTAALEAIDAALAIDPDFLAAHALRDRIHAGEALPPRPLVAPPLTTSAAASVAAETIAAEPITAVPVAAAPEPLVSTERYASFEQRTKRRRVDRRLDAARSAIASGHVRDAESALDEVRELDPNVPDLVELTPMLEALRSGQTTHHPGRWVAAAAAFLVVVAGATWVQETGALRPRPLVALAPPAMTPESTIATASNNGPAPSASVVAPTAAPTAATTGVAEPPADRTLVSAPAPVSAPPAAPAAVAAPAVTEALRTDVARADLPRPELPRPDLPRAEAPRPDAPRLEARTDAVRTDPPRTDAVVRASESREPRAGAADVVTADASKNADASRNGPSALAAFLAPTPAASSTPPPIAAPPPPPSAPVPIASAPPAPAASVAPAPVVPTKPNDELLVNQVLQRYRKAYEGLDAPSAHAVWPAVNEAALARAFDGLQSQTLTFDTCDVNVKGGAAAATCRGSARYVPKVGNHDPLIQSRTWNFTLKKDGDDWKIESARANR